MQENSFMEFSAQKILVFENFSCIRNFQFLRKPHLYTTQNNFAKQNFLETQTLKTLKFTSIHALVAQLGLEHDTPNVGVAGSSPAQGVFKMKRTLRSVIIGISVLGACFGCDNSDSKNYNYEQIKYREKYSDFNNPSEREESAYQKSIIEHPKWYRDPLEKNQ